MYVKVKYYKSGGFYGGPAYTYATELPLRENDQVIAPTAKEVRMRAVVTEINAPEPMFPVKSITEYDPEGAVVSE